MNILKPLSLAILHKPFSLQGCHYLSIGALGFFKLGGQAALFQAENLQWQKALKHLTAEQPLDMAMPKGRAEFLVGGNAHAPAGKPVVKMQVGAAVGALAKTLTLYGDRQWYYGLLGALHISEPQPFTQMSLGYGNAFGGDSSASNPLGKGYYPNRFAFLCGRTRGDMPNLEYPDTPVRNHTSRSAPASFGATDIRWQPRCKRAGTYDEQWVKNGFPGLADNVDMALFNQAAEDQWAGDAWLGGEAYQLQGMHPQKPVIAGTVPEFRVRALLDQCEGDRESYQLVELAADTLWFFPEEELGLVIYRGVAPVADSDALDVKSLLLAYENLTQSPRPEHHYRRSMMRRLDRKTAAGEVLNEAALIPELSEQMRIRRKERKDLQSDLYKQRTEAFIKELKKATALPEALSRGLAEDTEIESSSVPLLPNGEKLPMLIPRELTEHLSLEDIVAGGVDLGNALEELDVQVEALKKAKELELADEQERLQALFIELHADTSSSEKDERQYQEALEKASLLPIDLHPEEGAQNHDVAELLEFLSQQPPQQGADMGAQLADLAAMQRQARAAQIEIARQRQVLSLKNGERLGLWLLQLMVERAPLAGRDLADVRLRGVDFSRLDLREVNFEGADLAGCSFVGADLSGANFLGASLAKSDFSDARLAKANFSRADCAGALFDNANLESAFAVGADMTGASLQGALLNNLVGQYLGLNGANLSGAELSQAVLVQAVAESSIWKSAIFKKSLLSRAQLNGADFSDASMERTVLNTVTAVKSVWCGCRAERSFFGADSDFSQSIWDGADFRSCGMRESNFCVASMRGASFYQCDFSRADMTGAQMPAAILCRSLFTQARKINVNLVGADLHQAICRKVDFSGADLSQANLVQADLIGVVLKGTRLDETREQVA